MLESRLRSITHPRRLSYSISQTWSDRDYRVSADKLDSEELCMKPFAGSPFIWSMAAILFTLSINCPAVGEEKPGANKKMTVAEGNKVTIEYTLSHEGKQLESNVGNEPLSYVHGAKQIIPGLEKELNGLAVGDTKKVTVNPEEGYGMVDDEAMIEVPKANVPEEAHKVGTALMTKDPQGNVTSSNSKRSEGQHVSS